MLMMQLTQTTIHFPDIKLKTRDAHKLRGYFGKLFKAHSPLLHNHFEDGSLRYAYPLVQYKIINNIAVLVGFNEGADLLVELFLKIKQLNIEKIIYPVLSKNIHQRIINMDTENKLYKYNFATLWMALNKKNFDLFLKGSEEQRKELLNKTLQNNILSFYKGIGYWTKKQIMVTTELHTKQTLFKNKTMTAFSGSFVSNAFIPDYTGIGKAVSRGFGTVMLSQ
jgi:hypothetical protein